MIKVSLYNYNTKEEIEFECLMYDIEKSYYKFYLNKHEIRYVPSYNWVLDLIHPYEVKIEKYD